MEKIIKNKIAPYEKEGRWYKFFIESDGIDYTLTSSPMQGAEISSTYLKCAKGFHIVDSKIDVHFVSTEANNTSRVLRSYADGSQGIALPNKVYFDYMYVYVFGHYEA